MKVNERRAYRDPPNILGKSLIPADLLQFGPPCGNKVRIRCRADEYPGLDQWVPRQRLLVPWPEAPAILADEVRFDAVVTASHPTYARTARALRPWRIGSS